MQIIKLIEKLEQLHQLIKNQNTGSPEKIATTIGANTRLVYDLINRLIDMEKSLCYDSNKETYYYADGFQKQVIITISVTETSFLAKILENDYVKNEHYNFRFT